MSHQLDLSVILYIAMEHPEVQNLPDIIERAKHGDHESFSWLYTTYFTPVYRYIYYRTGSRADAEDIVQNVFLKAYESFDRYSYRGTSPLAYFYTIARNLVIDHRRKMHVAVAPDEQLSLIADPQGTPLDHASQRSDADHLHARLQMLPDDQQEAIALKYISDLSNEEISAILGKSQDSVRQLQSRGLKSLRQIFKDDEY